jgi:toxin ParE1/3/4
MIYIVKARARQDIKKYWHHIAEDNLDAANRFLLAAEETFRAIARNPDIGSQRSFRKLVGVRSRQINRFEKYLVFYKKRRDQVVIGRVIHGMRDLPRFFRR